jgi:hypothetical protein
LIIVCLPDCAVIILSSVLPDAVFFNSRLEIAQIFFKRKFGVMIGNNNQILTAIFLSHSFKEGNTCWQLIQLKVHLIIATTLPRLSGREADCISAMTNPDDRVVAQAVIRDNRDASCYMALPKSGILRFGFV